MLTENEQDTSHKLYDLHGTLAGNPVLVSSVLGITVKFCSYHCDFTYVESVRV